MRLVELKTSDGSIWVNPAQVAFVEARRGGSEIYFAAIGDNDSVLARMVALSPNQVAEQLNVALRGA